MSCVAWSRSLDLSMPLLLQLRSACHGNTTLAGDRYRYGSRHSRCRFLPACNEEAGLQEAPLWKRGGTSYLSCSSLLIFLAFSSRVCHYQRAQVPVTGRGISAPRRVKETGSWWPTPFVPALGRQRQVDLCELEDSLVYLQIEFQDSQRCYIEKPCL